MKRRGTLWMFLVALMWVASPEDASAAEMAERPDAPPWVVVVNPNNTIRTLARSELERIYRRTIRFWDELPDTPAVLPINLPPGNALREDFSRAVLHADAESLATYWNRQYFQGVLPPIVLRSPAAVRAYVAATPGAIGYLPIEIVDSSVAVVRIVERN